MLYRYMAVAAVVLSPALVAAQGLTPQAAAQEALAHLDRNQTRYGITSADVAALAVTDAYTSRGVTHVYVRQTLNGIEAVGTEVGVHLDRNGHVFHVAGQFTPGLSARPAASAPALSAATAADVAARAAGLTPTEPFATLLQKDDAGRDLVLSDGGVTADPVMAQLVYVLDEAGAPRLAWEAWIAEPRAPHVWRTFVDATTGAVLQREDEVIHDAWGPTVSEQLAEAQEAIGPWLFDATPSLMPEARAAGGGASYKVYDAPIHSPHFTVPLPPADARTVVTGREDPTASPFGWHDTDGAAGAEYTITRGNNVYAYPDTNNDNSPDATGIPDGGATLTFDFPLDLTQAPATYKPAATTNLFFWNNIIHDIFYGYGFDEPSGNFQENNYGRGGFQEDGVMAEAQDGGGFENANFYTPPDGGCGPLGCDPRMQMYLGNTANPDVDGDLDNHVIAHEAGHGISKRLTGGPTNTCLTNSEQGGEGWSDWFGLMLTMRPTDTAAMPRPVGTYLFGQPSTGPGIRPAPYSTDFAVNNFTYQRTRSQAVPHGVGFVWATILWEATWDMIAAHGFEPDLYNESSTAGNIVMLNIVTEALKLQPCSPGFVDARDAILAADQALYGGAHLDLLWEAFARRGLGFSASQGSPDTNSDNTEAFNTPEAIPPAPVTDLAVLPDGDFVTLTFTATGDDGATGTAESYDIRYSTTGPITNDTEFNAATQVAGEPAPQVAGTAESIVVPGLTFSTTYHFAIKVSDESFNQSTLSNPAAGTTLGAPVLAPLATPSVTVDVSVDGTATVPFTLANTGPSTLRYAAALAEAAPRPAARGGEATEAARGAADAGATAAFAPEQTERKGAPEPRGAEQARGAGGPDAFGYRWIDSDEPGGPTFDWVDIAATGTSVSLSDDGEANLALPFTFEFYGVPYTQVRLSSNGHLSFTATGDLPYTNDPIPDVAAPNAVLAPFWDDLNPSSGGAVYYQDMGDGRFVVQWEGVPHYPSAGSYTFQVILMEGGAIYYQYESMSGDLTSATVGIENETGTVGLQVVFNGPYVHDGLAVRFAALWVDAVPASGTVAAGGSGSFDLVFDAAGMPSGQYHATLTLTTNDPANAAVTVPITFNVGVTDAAPGAPAFEGTHLLSAVRPNPFAGTATATLAVRESQAVTASLYDALGRRVAVLLDGEVAAGTAHTLTMEGAGLSAGAYVLRVEGETFSETRRITLTR